MTTAIVVGAGPAGLGTATALRRATGAHVIVLDREQAAGGAPRHTDHLGFGLRDLRRVLSGPAYATRLADRAAAAGVELRLGTTATHLDGDGVTLATGERLDADAVVVATGARERPRAARLVPGDRPAGVFTTGAVQQLTALAHLPVGRRAVVVGAEHVSFSAIWSLRHGGCETVALVTPLPRHQTTAALRFATATIAGVPVRTGVDVARIAGRERVEKVELTDGTVLHCDTVVFTGDWIPDGELARLRGLDMDRGSRAPLVDTALRTSLDGVFAAGNLLHPVDTADVAALDGRHVAAQVLAYLAAPSWPVEGTRLVAGEGFAWIAPGVVRLGDPPPARSRLLLWPTAHRSVARVVVRQDDAVLARRVLPWAASPGRVFRVPWGLLDKVDPSGGDVTVSLA